MFFDNDKTVFLKEFDDFLRTKENLSEKTIRTYESRIIHLLDFEYTVGDLCGGIDNLVESYGKNGNKYNKNDSGNTKAALNKVRKMLKGNAISSLYISYSKGLDVFQEKGKYVIAYTINKEKLTIQFNTSAKKISKNISPVDVGKLIDILQDAEKFRYFGSSVDCLASIKPCTMLDVPTLDSYQYRILNCEGCNKGEFLGNGTEPGRIALKNKYALLIDKLINQ